MKRYFNKSIILLCVFVAAIGSYFIINYEPPGDTKATMGEAGLPLIYMCNGNEHINILFGYRAQMDAALMKDSLTPIPDDRVLKLMIDEGASKVVSIDYELRSIDTTRLIEKNSAASYDYINRENEGQFLEATLNITNIIEDDTSYLLIISITTEEYGKIYYFTHLNKFTDKHFQQQIQYVYDFSIKTLDKMEAESLIPYLEPSAAEDNTNLGKVSIYSNFNQITWGDLKPKRVTNPIVTIKEVFAEIGSYELKYIVRTKNEYGVDQYYNVTEFYRVRTRPEKDIVLLNYDRTMNQIFNATGRNISTSRINLGIGEELSADISTNEGNTLISFVKERSLWCMNTATNQVVSLFSFADGIEDEEWIDTDIRNINDMHDINVIRTEPNGNVHFIVYGYMNRGEHEGRVGITLYQYTKETNLVEEVVFIPYTKPYGVLKETMGKFIYVNSSGKMYVMLDNSVFSVDLEGKEPVEIVSGLYDDNYVINRKNNIIAWQTGKNVYDSTVIRVLNIETGDESTITAEKDHRHKVLGYTGDDLVYGIAKKDDIVVDENGYTTFAMSEIKIVDDKGEVLREYSKKEEGIYITDAMIEDNLINLKRVKRDGEQPGYVSTQDDQIIKSANQETEAVTVSTIATDSKKKETVINFAYKVTTPDKLGVIIPEKIIFDQNNAVTIRNATGKAERYYVYGKGRVQGIYSNPGPAVRRAYDLAGVVTDGSGNYVWARVSRPEDHVINDISYTKKQIAKMKGLDLSGCSLEQVMYYIFNRIPIAAYQNDDECVVIVGFDFYNVILYNPVTDETYKEGFNVADELFKGAGNKFFTLTE